MQEFGKRYWKGWEHQKKGKQKKSGAKIHAEKHETT